MSVSDTPRSRSRCVGVEFLLGFHFGGQPLRIQFLDDLVSSVGPPSQIDRLATFAAEGKRPHLGGRIERQRLLAYGTCHPPNHLTLLPCSHQIRLGHHVKQARPGSQWPTSRKLKTRQNRLSRHDPYRRGPILTPKASSRRSILALAQTCFAHEEIRPLNQACRGTNWGGHR